jgi:dUTP pyrophosphatase
MNKRFFEEIKDDKKKHHDVETIMPVRADTGSAGCDFHAKESIRINPGEVHMFWTDVKVFMQEDEYLSLHVRSSIGVKKKLLLACGTGIIDASYYGNKENDGNICIPLYNYGLAPQHIFEGERIAQGIFHKYLVPDDIDHLNETRTGGYGSSGQMTVK